MSPRWFRRSRRCMQVRPVDISGVPCELFAAVLDQLERMKRGKPFGQEIELSEVMDKYEG